MTMKIFKFVDKTDRKKAFVIAINQQRARKILSYVTAIDVEMVDARSVSDFPKSQEFLDQKGEGIWINQILPF